MTPKRGAAADVILPEPRLRLVHAHARRVGEQRPVQLARQPLIVERVAAFVQRREDRSQRIVGRRANRDADIVLADHHRERMRRAVESAAREVEAHVAKQRGTELPLAPLMVDPARQQLLVRTRALRERGHERAQPRARRPQQRVEARAAHARLVLVEQSVVAVVGQAERLGPLAHELEQLRERIQEHGVALVAPRLLPCREAMRARFGEGRYETLG